MTGNPGVESDRSTNWATTTAWESVILIYEYFHLLFVTRPQSHDLKIKDPEF